MMLLGSTETILPHACPILLAAPLMISSLVTVSYTHLIHGNSHGDLILSLAHQNSHHGVHGLVADAVAHAAQGVDVYKRQPHSCRSSPP